MPECVQNEMRENIKEIKIRRHSQIIVRRQKPDKARGEQRDCGNDEEHSRSRESTGGFPYVGRFSQS